LTIKTAQTVRAVRVQEGLVRIGDEVFEITTIREVEYLTPPQADLAPVCPN
jgi:hypothetical protein